MIRSRLRLFVSLIAALFLTVALSVAAVAGETPMDPGDAGGILYHGSKGFLVNPPQGFVNDEEAARRHGVHLLYVPEGETFATARVFIYPNTGTISGEGADAARDLAAFASSKLAARPGGQNLTVTEGRNIPTRTGETFFTRHFNQGPPPNEWETVAYLPKNGTVLMLVLSARDEKTRDETFAVFEAMARDVALLEVSFK